MSTLSPNIGRLADNVTEVAGEVLTTGKDLASDAAKHLPEVTESVGKMARSSADVIGDLATTALALTPFVNRSSRSRRRPWWLAPVAVLGVVAVLAALKRRSSRSSTVISGPQALGETDNVADIDRKSAKTA